MLKNYVVVKKPIDTSPLPK